MSSQRHGRMEIALATHVAAPTVTSDDRLLIAPLERRLSARVDAVPWDAPDVDWGRFDAVIVRSTWNYHLHHDAFLAWADRVESAGTMLCNPASVLRWNADKRYLLDLAGAGLTVAPTEIIARDDVRRAVDGAAPTAATDTARAAAAAGAADADAAPARLREILDRRGWDNVVLKPTVSATSFRTFMTRAESNYEHAALLETVLAGADVVVQPLLSEVQREGEWSFMFLLAPGGALEFSHCVLKRAARHDFRVQPEFGGTASSATPPAALLRQAQGVAAVLSERAPAPLLYARCDGVVSDGTYAPAGMLLLMEAELIEPMLFLRDAPGAADRFANGLAGVLAGDRQPA